MKSKGFTLIELMIVIAIIGILVSVVMPSYRHYVIEVQRTDVQSKILQIIELQERFYTNNRSYTINLGGDSAVQGDGLDYPLANLTDPVIISFNDTPAFSISLANCLNSVAIYPDTPGLDRCFRVIATPLGDQTIDGGLVADNRGRKILDYGSRWPRDWDGNDLGATLALSQAACPECAGFPDSIDE